MRRSYLDTSIIRKRLSGTISEQDRIDQRVSSTHKLTSKYVKQEFLSGHFIALIKLFSALVYYKKVQEKIPSTSIDDAFKRLSNDFSPRAVKSYFVALVEAFNNLPDRKDFDAAIIRCKRYLKSQFFIFSGSYFIRYETNHVNCYFQDMEPDFAKNVTTDDLKIHLLHLEIEFNKDMAKKCNGAALLKVHKGNIQKICDNNKSVLKKEKRETLLKLANGQKQLTCRLCRGFGDIFVTLECPDYARLYTVDNFFTETCPALNKDFEIIPPESSLVTDTMIKEEK